MDWIRWVGREGRREGKKEGKARNDRTPRFQNVDMPMLSTSLLSIMDLRLAAQQRTPHIIVT